MKAVGEYSDLDRQKIIGTNVCYRSSRDNEPDIEICFLLDNGVLVVTRFEADIDEQNELSLGSLPWPYIEFYETQEVPNVICDLEGEQGVDRFKRYEKLFAGLSEHEKYGVLADSWRRHPINSMELEEKIASILELTTTDTIQETLDEIKQLVSFTIKPGPSFRC